MPSPVAGTGANPAVAWADPQRELAFQRWLVQRLAGLAPTA